MGVSLDFSGGHRERKKQRTKEQLIDAALRLFIERGYESTRIDDIVAEVGLVPRTFFRYFCSKDDALFGWYDAMRHEVVSAVRARPSGEGIVRALIAAQTEVTRAHREHARLPLVVHQLVQRSPEIKTRWAASRYSLQHEVAHALARRLPPSAALVSEMVTGAVQAAMSAAVDRWAAEGGQNSLREYWVTMIENVVEALAEFDEHYVLR